MILIHQSIIICTTGAERSNWLVHLDFFSHKCLYKTLVCCDATLVTKFQMNLPVAICIRQQRVRYNGTPWKQLAFSLYSPAFGYVLVYGNLVLVGVRMRINFGVIIRCQQGSTIRVKDATFTRIVWVEQSNHLSTSYLCQSCLEQDKRLATLSKNLTLLRMNL